LVWDEVDAHYYNIYSISSEGEEMVRQEVTNVFYDVLPEGSTMTYHVTAVNTNFYHNESFSSLPVTVVNEPVAAFRSVRMIGASELLLSFDRKIYRSSTNMMHFYINNGVGYPSSVHFIDDNMTLYMSFFNDFPEVSDLYLTFSGLFDANGRVIPDMSVLISYEVDVEPPFVVRNYLSRSNQVAIHFSKRLCTYSASDISNFIFETPPIDRFNTITNVTLLDSIITITLSNPVIPTVERYYLTMLNIKDLAGNSMLNNHTRIILNLTEIGDLNFLLVYPNPIDANLSRTVVFTNLPETKEGELRIFNISGELVFNRRIENQATFAWDVSNNSGRRVASGLYHYVIRMGNENRRGQIVVVR
jgi:hypothetical protein